MARRNYCALAAGAFLVAQGSLSFAAKPESCDVSQDFSKPQWQAQCAAAISKERDASKRAELLHKRAYVAVEQYRYDDALTDLKAAIQAYPDCTSCLRERAYIYSEIGNYQGAIADLDHQLALVPDSAGALGERAFARSFSGDLEGAYQDRARALELEPQSNDSRLARGEAALWLGRFDDADADFARVEAAAKEAGDDKLQSRAASKRAAIALWRGSVGDKDAAGRCQMQSIASGDPRVKQLIGDCTQAFLLAKDGPARADALTTRSNLWPFIDQSWDRLTLDRRIAAGFDPANPDRYVNLGFAYVGVSHSRAAIQEFDRALAMKQHFMALAGRANARSNIGDIAGAEADALASMKIEANELAAWVLGDIALERGDREKARLMYLGAYQLGSRDDRLIAKLKELGVDDPAAASQDAKK